jgi:hypothetical protein
MLLISVSQDMKYEYLKMLIVLEICETIKSRKKLCTKRLCCSKCHNVNFAFTAEITWSSECKADINIMVWPWEENCATLCALMNVFPQIFRSLIHKINSVMTMWCGSGLQVNNCRGGCHGERWQKDIRNLFDFKLRSQVMQMINFVCDSVGEIKFLVILGIQYGQNMKICLRRNCMWVEEAGEDTEDSQWCKNQVKSRAGGSWWGSARDGMALQHCEFYFWMIVIETNLSICILQQIWFCWSILSVLIKWAGGRNLANTGRQEMYENFCLGNLKGRYH